MPQHPYLAPAPTLRLHRSNLWILSAGLLIACRPDASGSGGDGTDPGTGTPTTHLTDSELTTYGPCEDRRAAIEQVLATLEDELISSQAPGAAIAIICDGELILATGIGLIDADGAAPITSSTRFQIASTTKMFTAAAALTLVEDGLVAVETEIEEILPHINTSAPYDQSATLHQLLTHTAGYPTWFPDGSWASYVLADFFANNADQPLWSPPGALYNYSNLGFSLAGLVLEEIAGLPFADLVEQRVFEPAGMSTATLHADRVAAAGDFALGHSGSPTQPTLLEPEDSYYATGYYGPMGGAWASVDDLARWGLVHLSGGGDVMGSDSMAALQTPHTPSGKFPDQSYGYGVFIDELYGPTILSHSGSVGGFLTDWVLVPEAGFGVFVTTNCDWYWPGTITDLAVELLVDIEEIDLSALYGTHERWDDYIGSYQDEAYLGEIVVRQSSNTLYVDFEDQGLTSELWGYTDDYHIYHDDSTGRYLPIVFWRAAGEEQASWAATLYGVGTRIDDSDDEESGDG